MILQRLTEHYDRLAASEGTGLAPAGFSIQKVSFCIMLEQDGRLNMFEDLRRQQGRTLRPQNLLVPGQSKPTGSGLSPCFLWDSPEYLLGFSLDPLKASRASKAFAAFRDAHLALEASINSPEFSAVCTFLRRWQPEQPQAQEHLQKLTDVATNFGVFRIVGQQHHVHNVVTRPTDAAGTGDSVQSAICLVSGKHGPTARLHEPKIKGVAGAQSSGALLVSFNAPAFESYGKDQGDNAPVSIDAAFKYNTVLNHLLELRDRRVGLGDTTVTYWADNATPDSEALLNVLNELFAETAMAEDLPKPDAEDQNRIDQAARLLNSLRNGTPEVGPDSNDHSTRFFILGLSPNASRLAVRLWIEADAKAMKGRLAEHVQDMAMQGGRNDRPLSIRRILQATGRAEYDPKGRFKSYDTKGVSPQLAGDLTRSVLLGSPYPQSLLATMVRRIRSDGEIAYARVSAIKAVLVRNSRIRNHAMEVPLELDTQSTDVAYRCGRLFAVLEKAQEESAAVTSKTKLNATIKDKYFGAATTRPSLIFSRLLTLNNHHLRKLDLKRKNFFNREIQQILSIGSFKFPSLLNLEGQGLFVVGYFQQRQDLFKSRKTENDQSSDEASNDE